MAVLYIRRYLGTTLNAASRFLEKAESQWPRNSSPCLRGLRLQLLGTRETSK